MSNIEHLLENGLEAVDKALEDKKDCYLAFKEEMKKYYNQQMFASVNITRDELWEIIQYIKFCREMNLSEKSTSLKGGAGVMAKYIDAGVLIGKLVAEKHFYPAIVARAIDETPTADVVEVVRCKNCKHWNCVSRVTEHMGCDIFCGAYGREYPTNPDDFCSYGERREVCHGK